LRWRLVEDRWQAAADRQNGGIYPPFLIYRRDRPFRRTRAWCHRRSCVGPPGDESARTSQRGRRSRVPHMNRGCGALLRPFRSTAPNQHPNPKRSPCATARGGRHHLKAPHVPTAFETFATPQKPPARRAAVVRSRSRGHRPVAMVPGVLCHRRRRQSVSRAGVWAARAAVRGPRRGHARSGSACRAACGGTRRVRRVRRR
jgi:hypothetical protein